MTDTRYEPAFPPAVNIPYGHYYSGSSGLSKREYFSGLAMQGELASQGADSTYMDLHVVKLAERSVRCADALIEELAKEVKECAV